MIRWSEKVLDMTANQDPATLAYSLNILRTHWTPSQRAMFAARRATLTKSDGGRRRHSASTNSYWLGKSVNSQGKSLQEAANEAGVGRNQVAQAKRLLRTAAPEVVQAVAAVGVEESP